MPLDPSGHIYAKPIGYNLIHELCQRPEGAYSAAIQTAPQNRAYDRKDRKEIPDEVVPEDGQIPCGQSKDVDDTDQLVASKSQIDDGDAHGDPLQRFTLSEETNE